MSFSLQVQPQTVTVKNMTRFQQQPLRFISDPGFQTVAMKGFLFMSRSSMFV